jgi:hypothetical protein
MEVESRKVRGLRPGRTPRRNKEKGKEREGKVEKTEDKEDESEVAGLRRLVVELQDEVKDWQVKTYRLGGAILEMSDRIDTMSEDVGGVQKEQEENKNDREDNGFRLG